ncbi:MAG: hypothetical protein ACOCY0_00600 [Roseicyclus sp.]
MRSAQPMRQLGHRAGPIIVVAIGGIAVTIYGRLDGCLRRRR